MKLLLSEEEKYADDCRAIKDIVEHYIIDGEQQVSLKQKKIRQLYNMANGVINQEDYIDYKEEEMALSEFLQTDIDDLGLMFYPIIPNIIQAILGEFDKRYSKYYVGATNPEHTNALLEKFSADLRDQLINSAEALFFNENPEPTDQQMQEFQKSEKIRDYYLTDYRSAIERWANHKINVDTSRLHVKDIERELLRSLIVTEQPYVHVNYIDGDYRLEHWPEEEVFMLKSPRNRDASESMVVGRFEHRTIDSILNEFANMLTADQVEQLVGWTSDIHGNEFVVNNMKQTPNVDAHLESEKNFRGFDRLFNMQERRYDDFQTDLVRVTHMYMLLPTKYGKLRYIGDGVDVKTIVSEDYKVTIKPEYGNGPEKDADNLVYGEHIDWFYMNTLWRAIRIDNHQNSWKLEKKVETDENAIWVMCQPNEIQYSDSNFRFGTRIPVHGGPVTNFYSNPISGVERAMPSQIMYNWLGNRMQQLIATEVGKFIIINQNMLPQDSFDGSWGKNNLEKFFMVAKDFSIAPADPSVNNMGQSATQISGGFGQVVDLTKTQELLEKANLMGVIKQDVFQQFGFTPQTLFGDAQPQQTASSQAQGMQRSLTQIQHYYTRLDEIMKLVWETLLETAQFKASTQDSELLSYMGDDKARVIFNTNTDGFLMHKLACYVKSSAADADTLLRIQQNALTNNTMGADALESAAILAAKTTPEVMHQLEKLRDRRQQEQMALEARQAQQQQELVQQNHVNTMEQLQKQAEESELEFQRELILSQIKAVGYGNSTAGEISHEVERLAKADLERDKFNATNDYRERIEQAREEVHKDKMGESAKTRQLQEKIKMKELELREKDIIARNKRSNAIAKD